MSGKHPPTGMSNPGPRAGTPVIVSGYWHVGTGGAIAEFVCRAHLFPSGPSPTGLLGRCQLLST